MSMLFRASFYFQCVMGVPRVNHQVATLEPLGSPQTSLFLDAEAERVGPGASDVETYSCPVRLNISWDVVSSLMSKE